MAEAAVADKREVDNRVVRRRILVVDDEEPFRREMSKLLGDHGRVVRSAPDGEAAIQLARSFRPDLVLMDIRLEKSRRDGIHVAAAMQSEGLGGRLFFVTAHVGDPKYIQRVKEAGLRVAGWIDKSAMRAKLLELVQREDSEMAAAAEIDHLYDRILDLVAGSAATPELQGEIDPLVRRLRALQQREVEDLVRQLHQRRHLERGVGWKALERARRLLQE